MNLVLIAIGIWLALDGTASVIKYWKQSWWEKAIRIVRIYLGLALFLMGWGWW